MKKIALAAGVLLAASYSASSMADSKDSQYVSDWWHQSVNVVGSYHTRFGPQLNNDVYLEYEAFAKKDWFDFYGYVDVPKFFGVGNTPDRGIWNKGSPLFMEIEPRFSIDKLTGTDLSFGPFKEWYFANNYIYDLGHNADGRQNTPVHGSGYRYRHRPADEPVDEHLCQIPVGKLPGCQREQLGRLPLQGEILRAIDPGMGRQPELHRLHQL